MASNIWNYSGEGERSREVACRCESNLPVLSVFLVYNWLREPELLVSCWVSLAYPGTQGYYVAIPCCNIRH